MKKSYTPAGERDYENKRTIIKRSEGEDLMILIDFIELKFKYDLSNEEVKSFCNAISKEPTNIELDLLKKSKERIKESNN